MGKPGGRTEPGWRDCGELWHETGLPSPWRHGRGAPDEIDRLMAMTDPSLVFLLYDTGHAYYGERIRLNCSASIMSGSRTSI